MALFAIEIAPFFWEENLRAAFQAAYGAAATQGFSRLKPAEALCFVRSVFQPGQGHRLPVILNRGSLLTSHILIAQHSLLSALPPPRRFP